MSTIPNLPAGTQAETHLTTLILGPRRQCPGCQKRLTCGSGYWWCRVCRKKVRPRAHTWLKGSHLPAETILLLIWCWQKRKAPGDTRDLTGCSYRAIARWYGRFREHLPEDTTLLCGPCAVDESAFGRQKFDNQSWVVGVTEVLTGRRKLAVVGRRNEEVLHAFVRSHVTTDSLLYSDGWGAYGALCDYGYGHQISKHQDGHFGPTAYIECVWSTCKRHVRRMYGKVITHYLPGLIREWEARSNFKPLFTNPTTYLQACLFHQG